MMKSHEILNSSLSKEIITLNTSLCVVNKPMSREGNLVVIATNIENGIHGEVGVLGD